MKQILARVSLVLAGVLGCMGQVATKPYAQILVNETMLRDADVASLSIVVPNPATRETKVVASNIADAIGREAGNEDQKILAGDQPVTTLDIANHRCQAVVPLRSVSGEAIGVLHTTFKSKTGARNDCRRQAEELRDELAWVIPSAQVLFDPFIVASSSTDVLAQRLTLETLARYPDILVLAFHVTAPGETTNRVVGINLPKFLGRASDDIDHDVAKTGKMIVQVIPSTHRMEVHMPLRAVDGSLVGTLVTVYLWRQETEAPGLISRSMKIRDELQPRIPNLNALLSREQQN